MSHRAIPALLAIALSGCGAADAPKMCAIDAPPAGEWRLHTDGTILRDEAGRVVTLRGVNAGGRSKFAPFAPFDFASDGYDAALAAYLDRAASWGVDLLRVPLTWAAVEPQPGADDAQFLQRYDALLDGAWARGMRTIVDLHQDVYAENFCGDGFPDWTIPDPKPAPHHDCPTWFNGYATPDVIGAFDRFWASGSTVRVQFDAMWDRLVARHRDRPGVIGFEILNEPSNGSADSATFEATTLTTFFTEEAARVRAAAPQSLVLFEPINVASGSVTSALERPAGDGLVFAPHYYQATTLAPHGDGNPDSVRAALDTWQSYGTRWSVPVILGEFGSSHLSDSAADYLSAHFDALDALGMSGTEWEYSTAAEAWNAEVFGVADADGSEFPVVSAIIRPHARAIAGSAIDARWDAATRTFTLGYLAGAGISEVALPARAYPTPPHLTLSGACLDTTIPNALLIRATAGAQVSLRITP